MNKDFILKKRKDFVRVAKGVKMVSSTVLLQAAPSLSTEPTSFKVGFTTTKKIGNAPFRNRTRRRLRAVAREIFPEHALANTEYVLIGRFNTALCPFDDLKKDVKWALKKTNRILCGLEEAIPPKPRKDSKSHGKKVVNTDENSTNPPC